MFQTSHACTTLFLIPCHWQNPSSFSSFVSTSSLCMIFCYLGWVRIHAKNTMKKQYYFFFLTKNLLLHLLVKFFPVMKISLEFLHTFCYLKMQLALLPSVWREMLVTWESQNEIEISLLDWLVELGILYIIFSRLSSFFYKI